MSANYKMTEELLNSQQIEVSAAEIHGILSGQICSNADTFNPALSCQLAGIGDDKSVIAELINMMGQDISEHLRQNDFSFHPLLPDDEAAFNDRLAELASWCDGFNAGFAGAFSGSDKDLHEETREVLSDFAKISELQLQNAEGLEEEE